MSKNLPPAKTLPFLPPNATCNARLTRGSGYCEALAGAETSHPGVGRCRLHGGASPNQDAPDGPLNLFRAVGLGPIIDAAEVMTHDDQEYLYEVSNNALVVTRAALVARMQNADASPKELADLSMALSRIDGLLSKYLNEEDPDASPNTPNIGLDAELARLNALENIT